MLERVNNHLPHPLTHVRVRCSFFICLLFWLLFCRTRTWRCVRSTWKWTSWRPSCRTSTPRNPRMRLHLPRSFCLFQCGRKAAAHLDSCTNKNPIVLLFVYCNCYFLFCFSGIFFFRWGNSCVTLRPRWKTRRRSWMSRLAPSRCWSRYWLSRVP